MQRILLAIAGAAAFCAAVTFLLQIAISRGLPATDIVLVTASATLLLSIGAAAFAYRAFNRANLVATELERLTRSMDAAIKDVSLARRPRCRQARRSERPASRAGSMRLRLAFRPTRTAPTPRRIGTARIPSRTPPSPQVQAGRCRCAVRARMLVDAAGVELRCGAWWRADTPISACSRSSRLDAARPAVSRLHFHVQPEEGKPVDIRRLEPAGR